MKVWVIVVVDRNGGVEQVAGVFRRQLQADEYKIRLEETGLYGHVLIEESKLFV